MFKFVALGLVNRDILPGIFTWMAKTPCFVQSGKQILNVAWTRQCQQLSENAPTIQNGFKYSWQSGTSDYGDSLGKTGRLVIDMCENFLLSYIGKGLMKPILMCFKLLLS